MSKHCVMFEADCGGVTIHVTKKEALRLIRDYTLRRHDDETDDTGGYGSWSNRNGSIYISIRA